MGKANNVSADAAFKSRSKREVINIKDIARNPAPGNKVKSFFIASVSVSLKKNEKWIYVQCLIKQHSFCKRTCLNYW